MKLKDACSLEDIPRILKSRGITLPTKVCVIKTDFSNSYVQMSELDHWLIGKDSDAGKD